MTWPARAAWLRQALLPRRDIEATMPDEDATFAALARHLEALSAPTRLEILHLLRTPKALHEIRVRPSREDVPADRAISRQAVTHHLEMLRRAGLVQRTADPRGKGDAFVLNHERLFALVDEIRGLAKLRTFGEPASMGETLDRRESGTIRLPDPPRLLVTYGRDDGVAFALPKESGESALIGRAPSCEIRLEYDPFLSGENTIVERQGNAFRVRDLGSKNGTAVNWQGLEPGRTHLLRSGDVLTVGRSLLTFQDA